MRVSCDTIQEKGKEEEGGGRKGVLGKEDRETERAHRRAALGGLMTFCSSLARAPRMQGPAGQWSAGVLRDLAKVGRRSLPWCAGRRWVRREEMDGNWRRSSTNPAGPQPSASRGTTLGSLGHTQSLTPRLPPTACTHLSGSSPWIAKSPGASSNCIVGYSRHVFQINRTWEAVPTQYLRQWTTGRHACKAKEQHRLGSLLAVGGHSLLGNHGERWRSLT